MTLAGIGMVILSLLGYSSVSSHGSEFVAVGEKGCASIITLEGEERRLKAGPHNLKCVVSNGNEIFMAAEGGFLLIKAEGKKTRHYKAPSAGEITSLAFYNGHLLLATDRGELFSCSKRGEFETVPVGISSEIRDLCVSGSVCYGVTTAGEIIYTSSGVEWSVFDFFKTYDGYYDRCLFSSIAVAPNAVAVVGTGLDGIPVMYISTEGTVWSQRELIYPDAYSDSNLLRDTPRDLVYHSKGDCFVVVTDHGKVLALPACSHCNQMVAPTTLDLHGVASNNDVLMVVGEDFFFRPIM